MIRWRLWAAGLAIFVAGGVLMTVSMAAGIVVLILGIVLVLVAGGGGGFGA